MKELTQEVLDFFAKNENGIPNKWYYISKDYELSENFIRENKDNVNWYSVSRTQKLTEDFIREFQDKVDWGYISQYQVLSEDFIREFKDQLNWWNVPEYQILSEEFIIEFQDRIRFCGLVMNKDLHNYSKNSQLLVFKKIIESENIHDIDGDFTIVGSYKYFTDYMKDLYEKYRIML